MSLELRPLTVSRLDEFKVLLGGSEFGGCFCAVWTTYDETWTARCSDKDQPNFLVTKKNVELGRHVGFMVYQGNDLVGWTGSGAKTQFPQLKTKLGSRLSNFSADVWSVGCLAISEKYRDKGLADRIVGALISEAKAKGARLLEAYPVRPAHEPRAFRGSYQMYRRLGFSEVGAEADGDHEIVLMNLELDNR